MKDMVRRGYDAVSYLYRGDNDEDDRRRAWVAALVHRLPRGARVLDLGCGCGVPVARDLAAAGLAVTGVDLSDVQVERARALVPAATFVRGDAAAADEVSFPDGSFDAVVCLYMLIHVPLAEQPALLTRVDSWLAPGGALLLTAGHDEWTGTEEDWLGGGAPMWWSHADTATYRRWFGEASFVVEAEEFVPEGRSGHALFWCRRTLG